MKKSLKALLSALKDVFKAFVDWVSAFFGFNVNTSYGRIMRYVLGTVLALILVIWLVTLFIRLGQTIFRSDDSTSRSGEEIYNTERLSENITYCESYNKEQNYLLDNHGWKVLKHISWIAQPIYDSLVCFNNGKKCGYFNLNSSSVVIRPQYDHAWAFSEGFAAVEHEGRIKFIDPLGNIVIDRNFLDYEFDKEYLFNWGFCAVYDSTGFMMGLIDCDGNWTLPPVYDDISVVDTFWILTEGNVQTVLSFSLDTIIPPTEATFVINDTIIKAIFSNHTLGLYNLQGQLVEDFQIGNVTQITYPTRDLINKHDSNPAHRLDVATCMMYEAELGWFGLISPTGKIITPPSFNNIKAIDKDLYLCMCDYGRGIILDSHGRRVK